MQPATTRLYLKVAADIVIVFGLVTALGAWPPAAGLLDFFADLLFWPVDGAQGVDTQAARLLAAIGGGVMAGWGATIYLLADRLYLREPALVRGILLTGLLVWFAIDSTGSVISGARLNVLGNLALLAMFLVPLMANGSRRAAA